ADRDPHWAAAGSGDGELGDVASGSDPPDLVAAGLREPEVAVRAGRDAERAVTAIGRTIEIGRKRELGDHAGGSDPPDLVAAVLREPEVAVGADRDAVGAAERRGTGKRRELRDHPGGGDPPDPVAVVLREPEVAVGAGRDGAWPVERSGIRKRRELGDHARGGDLRDLVAKALREPEVAVAAGDDARGPAVEGARGVEWFNREPIDRVDRLSRDGRHEQRDQHHTECRSGSHARLLRCMSGRNRPGEPGPSSRAGTKKLPEKEPQRKEGASAVPLLHSFGCAWLERDQRSEWHAPPDLFRQRYRSVQCESMSCQAASRAPTSRPV